MTRTPPDPSASTAAVLLQLHDFLSSSFVKERLSNSLAFDSFVRNQASVGESKKKKKKKKRRLISRGGFVRNLRTMLCTPLLQVSPAKRRNENSILNISSIQRGNKQQTQIWFPQIGLFQRKEQAWVQRCCTDHQRLRSSALICPSLLKTSDFPLTLYSQPLKSTR